MRRVPGPPLRVVVRVVGHPDGLSEAVSVVSAVGVGVPAGSVFHGWIVATGRVERCGCRAGRSCGGHRPSGGGAAEAEPGQACEVVCGGEEVEVGVDFGGAAHAGSASAVAGSHQWGEVTPFGQVTVAAPRSMSKSALVNIPPAVVGCWVLHRGSMSLSARYSWNSPVPYALSPYTVGLAGQAVLAPRREARRAHHCWCRHL